MTFEEAINSIKELNIETMQKAQKRLDNLTKPLGSLGRLEEIVKQLAGITGELFPCVKNKKIVIMCADNGVVEEGVSSCPKSVTSSVTQNFLKGFTGVNVLSRHSRADIVVVDVGVDDDIDCPGVINRKIRKGTWNIMKGPAMTRNEAIKAIETGIEIVGKLKEKGVNLLGTGEMGVGNTTTSSAVASVLIGNDIGEMVGKGAGLTQKGLINKIEIIKNAIDINKPNPSDPIDVLAKVGGFDIAALTGCFLGAAAYRLPVMIDGFISATAALAAIKIKPECRNYILPSHGSAEPGNKKIMEALDMSPMLLLEMRLGEGSGAALAFHIIDAAVAAYNEMGTFGDAKIEQYKPLE
ncbi:nicotinate-nucleotide--dimethylbenzimidazole phosphoribosyltransferase [Ruminiclostridium cellulolyticum]|uniref:Nicotinate-nucleotide--dimethylbenzimidazole phosphoribosyltransferase n=1 Tax=Ruminiclostridium cellulolyticum (strain ATCC 35319 / DSM 5812 / JCM 6584 / H10) TaxID=394503 RepID=COBT_RUMCH|nr:nicotinate-nucleotide--dimethylbenzimidazole phosphoribosyltransferase [Ruminiclostridium cellulolyticum]B8I7A3.1 RecName: Full=Nicotinate-nucleotide--dimethylbenzimidazole phosphoribosyltransferase; Short=NN:DBI PRT; AltName: Full=N(1)-alpha-phosphoribosyltransferase [Ruminiclostridium cellulolyticum H10]ACL75027.1 nicotinate-nucleotide/dimethylbenzimidazole phosphoribosyltransferase [Ruminiclostridium cellulolyticum H10]